MQKKVLIVDDDKSIVEALSFMTKMEGYRVFTDDGQNVFEKLTTYHPDLVLLDVLLSGDDGRKICYKIKKDKNLNKIPIILLSARPSVEKNYTKYLANGFLAKPFDNDDLLSLMQKLI